METKPTERRAITDKDVWKAADALLLEGRRPTIEAVRQHIGRGSPNTITPHLDAWFKGLGRRLQDPGAYAATPAVPEPIAAAAMHFWEAALAVARQETAAERQQLEQGRQELENERQVVAGREAEMRAAEKAMTGALEMATSQLAEANRQGQVLEERCVEQERHMLALATELREHRVLLDTERLARANDSVRHSQEQQAEQAKFAAREQQWAQELDQQGVKIRAAVEQLDKLTAGIDAQRAEWTAQRAAAGEREKNLQAALAASERRGATSAADTEVLREQLANAHQTIGNLNEQLKAIAEVHNLEMSRLNEQLTAALRAVGRAWPQAPLSIDLRKPA